MKDITWSFNWDPPNLKEGVDEILVRNNLVTEKEGT